MSFADVFDMAFDTKHDPQTMIRKTVRLCMITDSLSLFEFKMVGMLVNFKEIAIDNCTVTAHTIYQFNLGCLGFKFIDSVCVYSLVAFPINK